jgi:DNA-binding MarR family transcriptional regulator
VQPGFAREWPQGSALATECILNVTALSEQLLGAGGVLIRRHGIPSAAAFNALVVLADAGRPLPPSVIAARMVLARPTVTGILRSLERRGLVRRLPHPQDGRMQLVAGTAEGHARLDRVLPELHAIEKRWMNCLSEAEQQALLAILARLQANAPPVGHSADDGAQPP